VVVVGGTVVALLIGGLVALWALQRQLIFFPDTSAVPPAARVIDGARDVTLRTADGLSLGAWFVPADPSVTTSDDARGHAVLLAPGNGGNRLGRAPLAERLQRRGFAVLVMDYRGYGGNPGSPSEDGLGLDADAAVEALDELGYPPSRTVYLGESLGTGVVAALARRTPPAAMVLRSPFTDLADVGAHHYPWLPVRMLLTDRFPVLEHVRETDVPVVVVHGDRDSVVPSRLSAEVAAAAPRLVDEVVLSGVDHNDPVMFGEPVVEAVVAAVAATR
jgi:pimeloyl-ACP methyl ester carboxylesterase